MNSEPLRCAAPKHRRPNGGAWLLWLVVTFGAATFPLPASAQRYVFTRADTLRGSITPERAWWDVVHYDLRVQLNPADSALRGQNAIRYRVLAPGQTLQIDLQRPLRIERVEQNGQSLPVRSDGDVHYVTLPRPQPAGQTGTLTVHYVGRPHVARQPPWDGGFVWSRDATGAWFIATACQQLGASAWWPCKDHPADEPDSMAIAVTVPAGLTNVSNGQLRNVVTHPNGSRTFSWAVRNPINNYGVNLNVARYVSWTDTLRGEAGVLPLSYYALPENQAAARRQWAQVKPMLRAFEHWFGPYPFYEDGYKLVQVPYLGMEHQSSVTYGNGFRNGYLGRDLSGTGWGLLWDFIIVHESGHEWFANNITYQDIADMWVHESFTNYAESLFTEYYYGKEAGAQYVIGCRNLVRNDRPIVGVYGVNHPGSGDMYFKGGNMLHTIRHVVNNDGRWREMLRQMNRTFRHQTVSGAQIEAFMSAFLGRDLRKIFDQYLRDVRIPTLEYRHRTGPPGGGNDRSGGLEYRWADCVPGFDMPLRVCLGENGPERDLRPTQRWQRLDTPAKSLTATADYYVLVRQAQQ